MNNIDSMIAYVGRESKKREVISGEILTVSEDDMNGGVLNLVKEHEGLFFDEFMKISEHDMREMYPETMWYCDNDILATKKALNEAFGVEADETAEEKKERERESYLKYKEFVMKKKGHKGGFR